MQLFDDEFDYRETASHKEFTDYGSSSVCWYDERPGRPVR